MTAARMGRVALAVVGLAALAGCGGRVARPGEGNSPLDAKLTCTHIHSEAEVNSARVSDLSGERVNARNNNAGILIMMPLFVDLSNSEQQEIKALQARHEVLRKLGDEKGCPL